MVPFRTKYLPVVVEFKYDIVARSLPGPISWRWKESSSLLHGHTREGHGEGSEELIQLKNPWEGEHMEPRL